jgi:hypothetical protein
MKHLVGASLWVRLGIPGIAVFVAAALVLGASASADTEGPGGRRGTVLRALGGAVALFAVTGALAASGVLANAKFRPPLFMPLMLVCAGAAVATARSSFGRRLAANLPLSALVLAQAFRLPLELVMHRAAVEGVMPVEMSFNGYNFDIVTGVTALVVAALVQSGHAPRGLVLTWNVLGSVLLAIVVGIAIAGMPWFAVFGKDHANEWVLHFPYVWLPTVLVPAALFGHIVIFKRLSM